ncbi:MAG: hypothetical protein WBP16_06510 [Ferruginibacter sp.]
MKKIVPFLFIVFLSTSVYAQNFTGQWKGEFIDRSTSFVGWGGDRCEYVLEIECKGSNVTGYSYTYFSDGGKRYYTICKLTGKLNKKSKYIEITEIERTKTNVPVNIRNCFQIHKLTYFQKDDEQILEGTWVPALNQEGDCGFGSTLLSRRVLKKNPEYYNNTITKKPTTKPPVAKTVPKKTPTSPVAKAKPKEPIKKTDTKPDPSVSAGVIKKNATEEKSPEETTNNLPIPEKVEKKTTDPRYEKRNSDLIKTIEIDNKTFNVNLYDNGEIDGDSISLFFNGNLILSHKKLSDKPISLTLNVDDTREVNELIMYAENLGTIPPNTALMVVNDGDNRYEVRISSDLQKSGVIRFVHKPKNRQ